MLLLLAQIVLLQAQVRDLTAEVEAAEASSRAATPDVDVAALQRERDELAAQVGWMRGSADGWHNVHSPLLRLLQLWLQQSMSLPCEHDPQPHHQHPWF